MRLIDLHETHAIDTQYADIRTRFERLIGQLKRTNKGTDLFNQFRAAERLYRQGDVDTSLATMEDLLSSAEDLLGTYEP